MENILARLHKGWERARFDEFHIQVLQEYRVAAAFAAGTLGAVYGFIDDLEMRKQVKDIAKECKMVIEDTSVYINDPRHGNKSFSDDLRKAIENADNAIINAGNYCNNLGLLFPKKTQQKIFEVRDICTDAFKRTRFGK